MRNLTLTFFLAFILHLVVGVDVANALPQCADPSYRHNCEDTVTLPNGNKYVGAWKDDWNLVLRQFSLPDTTYPHTTRKKYG